MKRVNTSAVVRGALVAAGSVCEPIASHTLGNNATPALSSSTALTSSTTSTAALSIAATQMRSLMIRPQGTVDPVRFPLGYISITGSESVETVYEMLKDGHYVVSSNTLQLAHDTMKGVAVLIEKEHPTATITDAVYVQNKKKEIISRILIRRDFWTYDDFNDPRLNESFGLQNVYFDNYQWSQHLWPQFQTFVEKWFPTAEHSHLSYREYLSLIIYFAAAIKGVPMKPLLPPAHRLKPAYGVPFPTASNKGPIALYAKWLKYFRAPLMLNKALVVRDGCGIVGMTTTMRNVPMVRVCDSSPLAVEGARDDAKRLGHLYRNISFMTADMFPPLPTTAELEDIKDNLSNPANTHHGNLQSMVTKLRQHTNYNLITYNADMPILRGLTDGDPDYHFAPGLQGYTKHLEEFFEKADKYLSKHGVLAIMCSNAYNLAYPDRPNPIEYEIKHNRRWVLMDYYDRPMVGGTANGSFDQWSAADAVGLDKSLKTLQPFQNKLRCELWILHKVEAIEEFGWIHGVPGSKPPSHIAKFWKRKTLRDHRLSMMKQQVELHGQDWGEYKSRMLRVLQENAGEGNDKDDMEGDGGGEPEDDEAAQIRMAMDPTYPMVLARRARRSMARKEQAKQAFHDRVYEGFMAMEDMMNDTSEDGGFDDASSSNPSKASSSQHHQKAAPISPRDDYDAWTKSIVAKLKADGAVIGGRMHNSDDIEAVPLPSRSIIGGPDGAIPSLSEAPYMSAASMMYGGRDAYQQQQYNSGRYGNDNDYDDDEGITSRGRRGGRSE